MESAPPGYNPNVSMLSGGTNTPIMPVQGGGSMPPVPGYNATVSLLQGGTDAQITAVKGGAVTFKENVNVRTIKKDDTTAQNVGRAVSYFSVEKYKLTSNSTSKPELESKKARRDRYHTYQSEVAAGLKKLVYVEEGVKSSESGRPTYEKCRAVGPTFFQTLGVNVTILENVNFIWLIPSLEGDLSRFLHLKEKMLDNEGKLPSTNHLVLFTGQFYPTRLSDTSLLLFDELLKMKEKNPNQVFALNDQSISFIQNSCHILENFYESKISAKGKELPLFLEPDVIVLPHLKILFRNVPLPSSKNGEISLSKALEAREKQDKQIKSILKGSTEKKKVQIKKYPSVFVLGQGGPEDLLEDYYQFVHMRNSEESKLPTARYVTIKCPPDESCEGFEKGFPLERLKSPASLIDPSLYLLYNNVNDLPYLYKGEKVAEAAAEKKEVTEAKKIEEAKEELKEEEKEEVKEETKEEEKAEEEVEEIPLPIVKVEPEEDFEMVEVEEESAFVPDPNAFKTKDLVGFSFNLNKYKIRLPQKEVIADWENLKFNEEETIFLRKFHLSPEILEAAFPKIWKKELAKFLENISYSKCFKDTQLLLATDCEFSRKFLRKIYYELYSQSLNKLYKRWGTGISLKKEMTKDDLNILDEILERQKALALFDLATDQKKMNILQEISEREKKLNIPSKNNTKLIEALTSILNKEKELATQNKETGKEKAEETEQEGTVKDETVKEEKAEEEKEDSILEKILTRLKDIDLPSESANEPKPSPKNKTRKNRKH